MTPYYRKHAAITLLVLCVFLVAGCRSKVVVGRSASDYPTHREAAVPQTEEKAAAAPAPAPAPEAKPQETPKPENIQTETVPGPPAEEKVEAEPAPQPAEEKKPTITQSSSRRAVMPAEDNAPYELDLSFGGFGLSQGLFDTPVALAVDSDENIYVVDQGNFRIQKFDRFGLFQFAWGRQGLGDGEFEVADLAGVRTLRMTGVFEFNKPVGILLDTDETRNLIRITVVDSLNHRIQRFLLARFEGDIFPDSVFVRLPEGGINEQDPDLRDRYSTERIPVILDPVYINDQKADSTFLTPFIWGGLGFSQGLMNAPTYIAKDDSGLLFVSDTGNGRLQGFYVTPENPATDTNFFREFGNALGLDYGMGRLKEPTSVVFDNSGYGSFLVLDEKPDGGHVIQRFDREGQFLGVFAESGGLPGQLRQPVAMAVSPFDNTVFITDRGHRKIMVYNSKGEFLFAFGGEELSDPRGIAVLRNNFVYVTDAAKNMIYRYIPR